MDKGSLTMEQEFTKAVRTLVVELNREAASGLISRSALIALDRVHRLLDAGTTTAKSQPVSDKNERIS